jgi:hypothetical protein
VSSWREERRRDNAAEAAERRVDAEHRAKLRRDERRKDRDEAREIKAQARRDKAARRQARAARREKTLTAANVYRKGTLALVAASALASLPAQVMHFVSISLMLLPLPFALEGAAWVMAAGVAYADERKLPAWVRWLLRALSMGAAGYAAHINFEYGAQTNASVAWGLAGVTVMGPAVFEIRQWVHTLSAAAVDPKKRAEEKARAAHEKRRRKDHKPVVDLAKQLVSAAPYGALAFEEAFASAWEILHGTRTPVSPELADLTIYVIDVAGGEKIPRKGGPGITRSDLLAINKIDLASMVGADLGVMERDARRMRGERPFVMTNLKAGSGAPEIARFIVTRGGLPDRLPSAP